MILYDARVMNETTEATSSGANGAPTGMGSPFEAPLTLSIHQKPIYEFLCEYRGWHCLAAITAATIVPYRRAQSALNSLYTKGHIDRERRGADFLYRIAS